MAFRLLLALARIILALLLIHSITESDLKTAIAFAIPLLLLTGIALLRFAFLKSESLQSKAN